VVAVVVENHRMPRYLIRGAVIGLLIATPVATWWHIGPLGAAEGSNITAAVRFRPPGLSEATETTLGRLASALVAASTAALIIAARRGVVDRRGWRALTPLLLLGVSGGAYWRLVTARIRGWDIAGGLLLTFVVVPVGGAIILGLFIWACFATQSLRSNHRVHGG
jgi:hypothetical protein